MPPFMPQQCHVFRALCRTVQDVSDSFAEAVKVAVLTSAGTLSPKGKTQLLNVRGGYADGGPEAAPSLEYAHKPITPWDPWEEAKLAWLA